MKRLILHIMVLAFALTAKAQTVLVVNTDGEDQQHIAGKYAELTFWGLPEGDETNADLTNSATEGGSLTLSVKAGAGTLLDLSNIPILVSGVPLSTQVGESGLFTHFGIYISTTADEQLDYDAAISANVDSKGVLSLKDGIRFYEFGNMGEDKGVYDLILNGLEAQRTYYAKTFAICGEEVFFGSEKTVCPDVTAAIDTVKLPVGSLFEADGIRYRVNDDQQSVSVIAKDEKYTGDVIIPDNVGNDKRTFSVTSIGNSAFQSCADLTSIKLPSSLTSIGQNAFRGCSSLTSVEIPSSVTSIGINAFRACSELTSIEIPSSVTSIGDYAFRKCSSLTSIEIPSSMKSIGGNAFSQNSLDYIILENDGLDSYQSFDLTADECKTVYVMSEAQKEAVLAAGYQGEVHVLINTLAPKVSRPNEAQVTAEFEMIPELENVFLGFEWRTPESAENIDYGITEGFFYGNFFQAVIKNLSTDTEYKVRAYCQKEDGTILYGNWETFTTGEHQYTEPVIHTLVVQDEEAAVIRLEGIALEGTDDIIEQGFEYWVVENEVKSLHGAPDKDIHRILAPGERMSVELTDLLPSTTYGYRAFATTASGTIYGEEHTFTTSANVVNGISNPSRHGQDRNGESIEVARYDVNGKRLAKPQNGVNIIRMSDGTIRKVLVK